MRGLTYDAHISPYEVTRSTVSEIRQRKIHITPMQDLYEPSVINKMSHASRYRKQGMGRYAYVGRTTTGRPDRLVHSSGRSLESRHQPPTEQQTTPNLLESDRQQHPRPGSRQTDKGIHMRWARMTLARIPAHVGSQEPANRTCVAEQKKWHESRRYTIRPSYARVSCYAT